MTSKRKLDLILFSLLGSQQLVDAWWNNPNKAFENKLPIEIWVINPDVVVKYIFSCLEGEW